MKELINLNIHISFIFQELPGDLSHVSECMLSCFSRVQLFATPWAVARQPPLSLGFSRQEYWSGLPFPSPEALPNPGIEPKSSPLQAGSLPSEAPKKPQTGLNKKEMFACMQ